MSKSMPEPTEPSSNDESTRKTPGREIFASWRVQQLSPFRKRRATSSPPRQPLSSKRRLDVDIEENDDEAERVSRKEDHARRFLDESLSVSQLTSGEQRKKVAECLKLNTENKINAKNAFQLQLIDLLVYKLKTGEPESLQTFSAYLDACGKIYGHRVDKVHSDLLRIVSVSRKAQNEENEEVPVAEEQRPKRKRKINKNILSSVEALKGKIETAKESWFDSNSTDALTSTMLFQVRCPQHVDAGIGLNIANGVILDRLPSSSKAYRKIVTKQVNDFQNKPLCPSYEMFSFRTENELNDVGANNLATSHEDQHIDFDRSINYYDAELNDGVMDYGDGVIDRIVNVDDQKIVAQNPQRIVDDLFEVIENQPINEEALEYSYVQPNFHISLVGPSYWKVKFDTNLRPNEVCNHQARRRKEDTMVPFTSESKEEAKRKFVPGKRTKFSNETALNWKIDEKVLCQRSVSYDSKNLLNYFLKPLEGRIGEAPGNAADVNDRGQSFLDNDSNDPIDNRSFYEFEPDEIPVPTSQKAFVGDNLVGMPSIVQKVFVPYSQREKRIDMHQLSSAIHRSLNPNNEETICDKKLSEIYKELPPSLGNGLSPAMAFYGLLDVAHKVNLLIENEEDMSDVTVKQP